jgi:hypothetical protein
MAGSDPKKTRDPGHPSAREDFDADEDPLVELARIVSEDSGGFSGRMTPRPRPRPRVEPAEPTVDRNAFSSDLEAELLHELETSFSGRETPQRYAPQEEQYAESEPEPEPERYAPKQYAPEPEPEPRAPREQFYAAPEPEAADEPDEPIYPAPLASRTRQAVEEPQPAPQVEDPDDLLRSIEEQLSQFEERVRSDGLSLDARSRAPAEDERRWSDRAAAEEDVEPEAVPEPRGAWEDAPGMAAELPEYRFRGPAAANWDRQLEEEPAAVEEPVQPEPEVVPEPVIDLFRRTRVTPPHLDDDYAEEEPIREAVAEFEEDEVEPEPMVLEEPELEVMDHGADYGARDFASLEEELSAELDSAYRAQEGSARHQFQEEPEDEPQVAAAAAIVPGPGMRTQPPQSQQPAPAARRQRGGRGYVMAAAVVIVLVIGGVGALYYRSLEQTTSGPPPVIAAPDAPVKIEPVEQADAGEETVGEAVFDRVSGNAPATEENVVEGAEEPREIARIVLPEPQGSGEEAMMEAAGSGDAMSGGADTADAMEDGSGTASETQAGSEDFGPRRVPTYVVRADGTIVETSEAEVGAGEADMAEQQMAAAQTEAMEPTPVETVPIEQPRTAGTPGEPTMASDSALETASAAPPTESESPAMDAQTEDAAIAAAEDSADTAAESLDQETEVAAVEPTQQVPPTATSGFLVQLSAQTSQEGAQATFADMQRRFPSILGDLEPNIQRADLDKGTYFRVRVGPWAERSQAIEVCEALKAAGADCYVAQ